MHEETRMRRRAGVPRRRAHRRTYQICLLRCVKFIGMQIGVKIDNILPKLGRFARRLFERAAVLGTDNAVFSMIDSSRRRIVCCDQLARRLVQRLFFEARRCADANSARRRLPCADALITKSSFRVRSSPTYDATTRTFISHCCFSFRDLTKRTDG